MKRCEFLEYLKEHTKIKQHNKEVSGVKDNKDETAKEVEGTIDNKSDEDSQMEELVLNDPKRVHYKTVMEENKEKGTQGEDGQAVGQWGDLVREGGRQAKDQVIQGGQV